jgi:hypothetical protein
MITIFCDFWKFLAKKLAFFSKTNVMIKILHYLALFWVKKCQFLYCNFRRKYFKNQNIGPWPPHMSSGCPSQAEAASSAADILPGHALRPKMAHKFFDRKFSSIKFCSQTWNDFSGILLNGNLHETLILCRATPIRNNPIVVVQQDFHCSCT